MSTANVEEDGSMTVPSEQSPLPPSVLPAIPPIGAARSAVSPSPPPDVASDGKPRQPEAVTDEVFETHGIAGPDEAIESNEVVEANESSQAGEVSHAGGVSEPEGAIGPDGAVGAEEAIGSHEAVEAVGVVEAPAADQAELAEAEVPERFADVMRSLATVGQLPLPERVEVFTAAHSRLQDALTSIDEV